MAKTGADVRPVQDCGDLTVSSSGPAGKKHPDCFGVFRATNMWSSGRRVYKLTTGERFLYIPSGKYYWVIANSVNVTRAKIASSCSSSCPASSRAAHHDIWPTRTGWQYKDWKWSEDSSITITCSRQTEDCL